MTDAGRKDISDKIGDKITPDSQKSTIDKAGDALSGVGDKAQRDLIPDSQKSGTQSTMDKMSREKDHQQHAHGSSGGDSLLDKAKHAVGMDK
ncbi:chaperone/heat shock protein [Teratosphaeria destructans]|uniref:Chaperone/heat shock protein n=1 Tax=Teratosphaeria destructans TaxID=418781 RepID=A0A9W7SKW0_9PEZI|nr:chaperone/heat shock protein [Teratosphaeria destructans]